MRKILTIAGSDSGGGAGIQADIKTITVLGGYAASAVTAMTAQNTQGVHGIHNAPAELVAQQIDVVLDDMGMDAAKTGMLSTPALIEAVAQALSRHRVPQLVVDPVMIAKGGARLLEPEAESAVIEYMLPLATLVTPNLHEASRLARISVGNLTEMEEAARRIFDLGSAAVLVKGGHLDGPPTDVLYDGRQVERFPAERINSRHTHGTGCTYSAAIATFLGQGLELREAVWRAKLFVTAGIREAQSIGSGHGPLNHYAAARALREQGLLVVAA